MRILQSPPSPLATVDGREVLYFVGTSYHCLHAHPAVLDAAAQALRLYGLGSATSRGRFGTTPCLIDLERTAAMFFASDDALHLPSGYFAASVLLHALHERFALIACDELSHHAVLDAAGATGYTVHRFAHRDPASLATLLKSHLRPGQRALVATDGLFPVRGTLAPLAEYAEIVGRYPGSALLVDDAHGLGVLGASGRGTLEHFNLLDTRTNDDATGSPLLLCGTLSKALGGYGGIIPGSHAFIAHLKDSSHLFNGASPAPPPVAGGSAAALRILMAYPELRTQLLQNARQLRTDMRALGLAVEESPSPIICLTPGNAANMQRIQDRLWEQDIAVDYIPRYPGAGPEGALRIAVTSQHTPEMLSRLVEALRPVL